MRRGTSKRSDTHPAALHVYCDVAERKAIEGLAKKLGTSMAAAIHEAVADYALRVGGQDEHDD